MGRTERRLDELEREMEDVKEEIEEIKENEEQEEEEKDKARTLYLYICFEYEQRKGVFIREGKKVVLEDCGNGDRHGYAVPSKEEVEGCDTTRQALQLGKCYVDCWEQLELISETEDAIYYQLKVSEEGMESLDNGYVVDSGRAYDLVNESEETKYI